MSQRRGQDWIGPELGVAPRTVARILRRHQVPYLRELDRITGTVIRSSKTTAVRYERNRLGELVHMDVKKPGQIRRRRQVARPRARVRQHHPRPQHPGRLRVRALTGR